MPAVLERYQINGIESPTPITSDEQLENYQNVLLECERHWAAISDNDKAFANVLAILIEKYESEKYPIRKVSPRELVEELIEANGLRQKDLAPEFGTESLVSEFLSGKRELNARQIIKLSERFGISPGAFF